ncbi:putative pentatricopeptide repeat-containing protein At1g10330 isoform X5 [Rosa rugosa]|uniref:putative pentatricopeptide repeat-containing protein At1g10330 isoform X5 n=1 Tax=Rosa rugosa TaxID=74645 RepID=UPI002B40E2FC|nr:putative pentatricopeptide repeat-containing protein At1g10330 isoform X5 [Rosa rugosa]
MLESLLQLLQRFLKSPNQIRQIHSRLITNGHLRRNPNPKFSTLFYNTLIRAHLGFGEAHKAFFLFTQMLSHRALPNSHTFPPLVKAVAVAGGGGGPCNGRALHAQVAKRGVWGDPVVQTSFVSMYARFGEVWDARKVFDEMTEPCVVACNAMIDGLGKNGDMGGAVSMFERMPERDVVSWTSVISGFGRNGWFGEGVWFFKRMMGSEDVRGGFVKPNEATFVSVLSSCANLDGWGSLYWGKQIHGYVVRNEVQLSVFMGTALVDLYGKSGCLSGAWNVFEEMRVKEVCTWNAMISALSLNGGEKEALELFEKMKMEKRLRPNEVTFVAVLTACARGNSVKCGLDLFKSMSKDFGVEPIMEHYGCVVDLLGRAGLFKEATELLKNMPFEPDASVLGALLGSCKIHGTTELANEVGKKLIELQPQHCGRYLVLSNIYAGNERWDHAAAVRKEMVHAGLQKIPAFSMIDVRMTELKRILCFSPKSQSGYVRHHRKKQPDEYEQLSSKIEDAVRKSINPSDIIECDFSVFSNVQRNDHPTIIKVVWENKEAHSNRPVPHMPKPGP